MARTTGQPTGTGRSNGSGKAKVEGAENKRHKQAHKEQRKKENRHTHTHTQLGIVFPRLSLSGANTKGAGKAGGSGTKGAHQLNLMTICGRRRRKEALKPNRKRSNPIPLGATGSINFNVLFIWCVCACVCVCKLTTTQLNAAGHRHTQSGHSQASRVLIYI